MNRILAAIFLLAFARHSAGADSSSSTPIPLDPAGKTVLMADELATPVPGITPYQPNGAAKYFQRFCVVGWTKSDQRLTWRVSAAKAGAYVVEMVSYGVPEIILTGGEQPLQAAIPGSSAWSRSTLGTVDLKAGESLLALQPANDQPGGAAVRSIDLIPVAATADYQKRVDAMRSDAAWMRDGKYGVMLQYGGWGYPEKGPKKPWEEVVKNFDVEKFAKMVDENMGAKWVIWSITWRDSHFPMPLKSVDAIVKDHTTTRDLPLDLAAALKKRGIKMMFYYHPGHEDPAWWAANWGSDDKARFLRNWQSVIAEIGNRYGEDLAGWFFDDASVYSPAPFEEMNRIAKSGSAKRLISYNSWALPVFTDFQDIHMGEMHSPISNVEMDVNGVYKVGPLKGNQAHAMMRVNSGDWGVWQPNTAIPLTMNAASAIGLVKRGTQRGEPISLNFDMYENGTVTEPTLAMFRQLKKAIRGPQPLSEGKPSSSSGQWAEHGPDKANDGNPTTFWSLPKGETTGWLTIDLNSSTVVSRVVIQEECASPHTPLVTRFTIEVEQADGSWQTVAKGTGIGAEKDITLRKPVKAKKIRLHLLESKTEPSGSAPVIAEFQLF